MNPLYIWPKHAVRFFAQVLIALSLATSCRSQQCSSYERGEVQDILRNITDDVKKHYYDPKLHNVDWEAAIRDAKEKIDKADSMNRALSHVAAVLDTLNDSHTFFIPPPRPYIHEYGFRMQMIGDHCYVVRVRPGSDAEAKGLKVGDELLTVNGYAPTRADFWKMEYVYNILRPQPGLNLNLRNPAGEQRQLAVSAKIRELPATRDLTGDHIFDLVREMENEQHLMRVRYADKGRDLLIVKLPEFALSSSDVDSALGKMQNHNSVVLDLRSNPGGAEDTLRVLLGGLFENKVKIGDRITRNSTKSLETETRHHPFTGKLIVLIDSNSGSASELFARAVQIEKRAVIVGDHSAGKVMEARHYPYKSGVSTILVYGASITEGDFKMTDGQSLEHTGVVPDKIILPTGADLANGRDPVLAQAAEMLDVKMTPEEAGALFPYEWPKD